MTDKVTISVNDTVAVGGAVVALVAVWFIHPAMPFAAAGVAATAIGLWRHRHEPPGGAAGAKGR